LNEEEMFLTSTRPTQLQAAVPVFTAPVWLAKCVDRPINSKKKIVLPTRLVDANEDSVLPKRLIDAKCNLVKCYVLSV
jgi:hypothetical protein